jgi:hypothetical protein
MTEGEKGYKPSEDEVEEHMTKREAAMSEVREEALEHATPEIEIKLPYWTPKGRFRVPTEVKVPERVLADAENLLRDTYGNNYKLAVREAEIFEKSRTYDERETGDLSDVFYGLKVVERDGLKKNLISGRIGSGLVMKVKII